ncbi:hypothetical protein [Alistipes sp.]|uniref:hypothetical protein n=1 Tax=Alistipes sp. TaxID=1872444 RepID=UPI003AEFEFFF
MHKKFELQYISKAVDWLIFNSVVKTRAELAKKMGYNPSTFSQIMEGKVGVTERFILKLQEIDNRLNPAWLRTGEGRMLQNEDKGQSLPLENEFQRSIIRAISAVEKIADSNRILAESNHDLTTTNRILASSNTELVQKLAELIDELHGKRTALYASASDPLGQSASDVEAPYDPKNE